jgi:hypothetical protein
MSQILPPPPPPTITGDSPLQRVHFRLWQIVMSAVTVMATLWFFTLNPIAGIVASFLAKHVLVAIYAAGLTPPAPSANE